MPRSSERTRYAADPIGKGRLFVTAGYPLSRSGRETFEPSDIVPSESYMVVV